MKMKTQVWYPTVVGFFAGVCVMLGYANLGTESKQHDTNRPDSASQRENTDLADRISVVLEKCYDGDTCTFYTTEGRVKLRVRLVGVDTPELPRKGSQGQPFSREAKFATESLLQRGKISLSSHGLDAYNRILAEVRVQSPTGTDEVVVNKEIVRQGLAWIYDKAPKSLDLSDYRQAEKEAKIKKLGFWSGEKRVQSASEYRKRERHHKP